MPAEPWQHTRSALDFQYSCMQEPGDILHSMYPRSSMSEDCLYLNVFTPPTANASSTLPVMFWVHGGGFTIGGSNDSTFNGTWLQSGGYDMVVCTINYRLNIFGFLGASELRHRDPTGSTGNYGIQDQRAALRWIQVNIRAFGGDPKRVMLTGESAGGSSVYHHLVRPSSYGLFSSAMVESGGYAFTEGQPTVTQAEVAYRQTLQTAGCASASCLEALSADTLLNVSLSVAKIVGGSGCYKPTVDGADLKAPLAAAFAAGALAPRVAVAAGVTREDLGAGYVPYSAPVPLPACTTSCTEIDFIGYMKAVGVAMPAVDTDALVQWYTSTETALPGSNYTKWYCVPHVSLPLHLPVLSAWLAWLPSMAGTG